ncbi:MAG: hypothetical protein J0H85_08065 [Sediminibacterium magnilacihabitans]|nr:hypothetical protein [Sediminibacterium magnilacihabitans]PQV60687.1 hypothetical protein CLV53_106123 [Sediminibacterium magnilacihabitans]
MKPILIFTISVLLISVQASSQGCVAIRSIGGMCMMEHTGADTTESKWMFNANNRYFKSFRHFVGTQEQPQRIANGTEVINHSYALDLTLTRILNKRWSLAFNMPILYNERSSLYEHGGKERHTTKSFGMGDVRFTAYAWILDPASHHRFNAQAGLGIKLPTGDYKYQDKFYTATPGVTVYGPVDQSIQLGDGGTGFTTELNAYYNLSHRVNLYGNFYYLINPREQNGVSTARGGTPSPTAVAYGSDVMSVPDQYMYRLGANFQVNRFTLSGGIRKECVPAKDLVGGSNGFRRPGYVVSVEPGVTYAFKKMSLYAYVPVAVKRDRTQSVPDMIKTDITGTYAQGDAAFADYSVSIGMNIRF